ncbi:MAG: transcription elongation factor subunit Spt4 [Candidatus Heimdallarchaeota archaeon]|nr:DNA-directed RNA polymerase, subunit E'' [Candidatus Heimdallarchaeota archaeon]RLI72401.1 MAG: DNA-directed RNA polymerase subunit E'' [Candidatus Gerdarchaeota archaeon]
MAKACKTCHRIIDDSEGNQCPNCKTHNFSKDYSGEVYIINPEKSEIAKKLNIKKPGLYALRVR